MIVVFVLGIVIGCAVAAAVTTSMRARAEGRLADVLLEVEQSADGAIDLGDGSVLERAQRALTRLTDAADITRADVERLEQALDLMADGVVVSDRDGRVVYTNAAGSVLAEARHEDALVAAAVSDCLRSAIAGDHATKSVELFGPPARTITVDAEPLGDVADPHGAVATIADESRLRRLESVRSDFVANVSHELKTPIGGLALLAEALTDADDPDDIERLSGRLLHEAHRVGRVVDDLLALSEIEGDLSPRREPVAVDAIIERMRAEIAVLADGFAITVDASGVAPGLVVVGDVTQLVSAVANLVENAIKYSGGASPVVVTGAVDGDVVRLAVTDRGIGIPSRDLDRVFERFYRVDQARSRATGGTGLGLAIVRNVVESHGGSIDLTSREGQGTTVVVRLPVAEAAPTADDVSGSSA